MSEISEEVTLSQQEVAIEQVVGFVQRFDEAHFHLACHAAFPMALTSDLLYQIWARFVDYAPWTAVAHLLLSQLCREVGHELYEMTTSVRNVLLMELREDKRFGRQRIEELADFLTGYVIQQLEGDNPNEQDLAQAQQWTALAYLNPGKATRELAEALQSSLKRQNITEAFRLASLIETFPSVLSDLGFSPLLVTYATGIKRFACGNQQSAVEAFLKLPIQDKKVEIAGVSLEIPEGIHLPSVKPNFLIQLLQLISTSDGDPQIVYPFLQENLSQLNVELAEILHSWSAMTLPQVEPVQALVIATAFVNFGNILRSFPYGSTATNLEIAMAACEAAAPILTREAFPEYWATAQNILGILYRNRIRGDRAQNLEQSILCFENALQIRTQTAFPELWAETLNNLGNAYNERIRGNRLDNVENAIAAFEAALEVRNREALPENWATTQNNLGLAYYNRLKGDRAENLEQTIACYQNALQIRTQEQFPVQWAETQNNLANAYNERIRGNRAENLEQAIVRFQDALKVYTFEAFPVGWAETQNNLATAYRERIRGDRTENLEQAIYCSQSALQVFTPDAFPYEWTRTQNNLAAAYRERIRGDRAENLEQAISCCQSALQVFTPDAFPYEWARTQNNLATAYRDRIRGDRAENLEQAIYCSQNALRVFTPDVFPEECLTTQFNLVLVFQETQNFHNAYNALALTINTLESLQGTVTSRQEISTLGLAKPYSMMVAVCLQLGRFREALEYVERSKVRDFVELLNSRILASGSEMKEAEQNKLQRLCQNVVTFEQMQNLLPANATLIEWYLLENSCITFIVTHQNPGLTVLQSEILNYQALVECMEAYLSDQIQGFAEWKTNLESYLHQLSEILNIEAILREIPEDCDQIVLVPHRFLHLLPLHTLTLSEEHYFLERFPKGVRYIPNCKMLDLIRIRKHSEFFRLFAIQNPIGDWTYSDIEVDFIKTLFPVTRVLTGQMVTRDSIEVSDDLAMAHCLHLACHTYSNLRFPLDSSLILANNELLTLSDVFALNLDSCKLVTFSAGYTIVDPNKSFGVGDAISLPWDKDSGILGPSNQIPVLKITITSPTDIADYFTNEYIGFPSAFLYAGSNAVVTCLWNVDDFSTALLMIRFYENLLSQSSVVVALNQAQQWLRQLTWNDLKHWIEEKGLLLTPTQRMRLRSREAKYTNKKPFKNPYYWAAFCVIGQ
jgi:CHAT domain-containing protein